MILQVGMKYKTREKGNVEIVRKEADGRYMGKFLVSGRSNYWFNDGKDTDGTEEWDIIDILPGQIEPELPKLPINVVLNIREVINKRKDD